MIQVKSFGATGDGRIDDTQAIQLALKETALGRHTLVFPGGRYRVVAGLVLPTCWRNRIIGEGGAEIVYDGLDPQAHVLTIADGYEVSIDDLAITAARPCKSGLYLYNDPLTKSRPSHNCRIRSLRVEGQNGKVECAVRIGGTDANNDFHQFDQCSFANYNTAGASLEATQAYNIRFNNCHFRGYGFGKYGVTNALAPGSKGGSFAVDGGFFGGNTESDIFLGTPSPAPISLANFNSEGSTRLFISLNAGASSWVRLVGIRYAGNAMHADRRLISIGHSGTTIIESCNLALYSSGASYIYTEPSRGHGRSLTVIGCTVASTDPAVFQNQQPTFATGNWRSESVHNLFPLLAA